jgi:large subunit ribosomal protein L15
MSMPMGPFRTNTVPVNVGRLDVFEPGSVVDLDSLVAAGLVKNNANRAWPVKILGEGEIDRALTVRADAFSASARAKIEAAGGTVELVGGEAPSEAPAPEAEAPQEPADPAEPTSEAPGDDADASS